MEFVLKYFVVMKGWEVVFIASYKKHHTLIWYLILIISMSILSIKMIWIFKDFFYMNKHVNWKMIHSDSAMGDLFLNKQYFKV